MYDDDELLAKLKKVLHAAKHAPDDVQMEVCLHGAGRLLSGNLGRFERLFAPLVPPPGLAQSIEVLGQQIVTLTTQRRELVSKIRSLEHQLQTVREEAEGLRGELQRRSSEPSMKLPKRIITKLSGPHRVLLEILITCGGVMTFRELRERSGLRYINAQCRLGEMAQSHHFGGALVLKRPQEDADPSYRRAYEITERGRSVLAEQSLEKVDGGRYDRHGRDQRRASGATRDDVGVGHGPS
jgi:hypothetical protein